MKECLRLYPVAPFLTRIPNRDVEVGGFTVPRGQLILISIFAMGRMSQYFTQPTRYWPGRWERNRTTSEV
jgi:ecdysteroid 2-hydroxylase